jgi:UDP-N-acetylmuramoyl-L-alanyl-D-glutamate--2,6-diaminopimelate ligase
MKTSHLDELISRCHLHAGITDDSRKVQPGYIFVAMRGARHDGMDFIDAALRAGATAIVGTAERTDCPVPYIQVADPRTALALLACALYRHPSRELLTVGITGTCGKTTVSYLVESILAASGHRPGLIGSIGYRYAGKSFPAPWTTPSADQVQSLMRAMAAARCDSVVMEVTSHGLQLSRVRGTAFDVVVFTNLSQDHLDFHGDMESYFQTKATLFGEYAEQSRSQGKLPVAVVNVSDEYGRRLVDMIRRSPAPLRTVTFAFNDPADLDATKVQCTPQGSWGSIGDIPFKSRLVGRFNVENLLAAVAVSQVMNIAPRDIGAGIDALTRVPGRLELVGEPRGGVAVFVDHAHKPGALDVVLRTLRDLRGDGRLVVVFGCGGERDRTKRPLMGRIAQELADEIWITSDNPRSEDPLTIIRDILTGISQRPTVHVEGDRRTAIAGAIRAARSGDIVVIAGRGHETYQILGDPSSPSGTRTVDLDDRQEAMKSLEELHS